LTLPETVAIIQSSNQQPDGANTMTKFAAHIGNLHASARVTPFFGSAAEAMAAASKTDHDATFIRECANWEEHQRWNTQRVGMYAQMPVNE
jgi:urease accessory protein UreE